MRSICQLSFLLYCNIYGYFGACYEWLIFSLKSVFTYFPGTLSKVPPRAFSFCSLVASNSSLSQVGAKTAPQFPDKDRLPGCLFPKPLCGCAFAAEEAGRLLGYETAPLENVLLPFRTENVCDTDCLFRDKWLIKWCLNIKGFNNLGVCSNVLNS